MLPISRLFSPSRRARHLARVLSGLGAAALTVTAVPVARAQNPAPARATPAAHSSTPALTGFWTAYGDDGRPAGIFYFYKKDGVYEGRLVKSYTYPGEQPHSPLCVHCTGAKKNQPMLGLVIVWGMKKTGPTQYVDGQILNPRDGSIWSAQLQVSPDDQKLYLRGYLGMPMLGQTRVWTRLPDNTMALADIPGDPLPGQVNAHGKKHGAHASGSGAHGAPHAAGSHSAAPQPQ